VALYLRLRATDANGQASDWTKRRTCVVDSVPPTVTLSAEITLTYSGTVVNNTMVRFSGTAGHNHGVGDVVVCLDGADRATCRPTAGGGLQRRVQQSAVRGRGPAHHHLGQLLQLHLPARRRGDPGPRPRWRGVRCDGGEAQGLS
jgi:hypothetical protein